MKRFSLLIFALALCSITYAQVANQAAPVPYKDDPVQAKQPETSLKGAGEVFWSTTFNWRDPSNPQGWSLPDGWAIQDLTDLGNYWKWIEPDSTLGGCCSTTIKAPSHFVSRADGYVGVPADPYNSRDGITTATDMNTQITTPPIDCSGKSSVIVKFNQYFRLCCNSDYQLLLQVTNDAGVHWANYNCRFGVGSNNITPTRYLAVEFNISDVAANLPNVQLRFSMSAAKYYFWMIDDLSVSEGYQNNLTLEDYYADANVGLDYTIGNVNFWPISQMGMDDTKGGKMGSYQFKGAIANIGTEDQNNQKLNVQVLRNGQEILNQNSVAQPLWTLERDTLTIADPFLATDYGDYQFKYTALGDVADEVPANNTGLISFTVNDTLYHRATFNAAYSSNGGGWISANNSGDMVGVGYNIVAPCEINSIYALIAGIDSTAGTQFQFVLYKDAGADGFVEQITSEIADATQAMRWTYQSLPMVKDGEAEFLTPGFYIACVRMMGTLAGDADGINGMAVGWDKDTKWDGDYSFIYRTFLGTWLSIDKLNQIGIVINAIGGPANAPVTFNVDMNKHIASGEFKPETDFVDVAGSFNNWSGSAHLTDPEADGIYTITLEDMPVGGVIEYKYRINGDWNTSEYPNGGPNRKYTVRYWNILNNTYNSGNTTGVDPTSLVASFSVYPNPASGAFTVDISNAVAADLVITLTNIQGQVMYQNTVTQAVNHQETISGKFAKGLYFLSVNNGKGVEVRKVVIQ